MESTQVNGVFETANSNIKLNGVNGHHSNGELVNDSNNNQTTLPLNGSAAVSNKMAVNGCANGLGYRLDDRTWSRATCVLGAQWGDEGKGKIVDLLASEQDVVCRCAVSADQCKINGQK